MDAERQWAEAECTHNKIAEQILADDFQGTMPDAKRYTKSEEMAGTSDTKAAHDCQVIDTKVRLFGDHLALAYGSESLIYKAEDGTKKSRRLMMPDMDRYVAEAEWHVAVHRRTRYSFRVQIGPRYRKGNYVAGGGSR